MTTFDRLFKRSFQAFSRAKEIQRLSILRILVKPSFGKFFCSAGPIAKLFDDFWIDLLFAISVEGLGIIKRRLQATCLVQGLDPKAAGHELQAGRVLRKGALHLAEVLARLGVIEIVEGLESTVSQLFKAYALCLAQPRAR